MPLITDEGHNDYSRSIRMKEVAGNRKIDEYVKPKNTEPSEMALVDGDGDMPLCEEVTVVVQRHFCATYKCTCDGDMAPTDPGLFPCIDQEVRDRLAELPIVSKVQQTKGILKYQGGANSGQS